MIVCLLHTHPLFKSDKGQVFDVIEEALHGTLISPLIAQFCKTCDGHGAYLALVSQHYGHDMRDKLQCGTQVAECEVEWSDNNHPSTAYECVSLGMDYIARLNQLLPF